MAPALGDRWGGKDKVQANPRDHPTALFRKNARPSSEHFGKQRFFPNIWVRGSRLFLTGKTIDPGDCTCISKKDVVFCAHFSPKGFKILHDLSNR